MDENKIISPIAVGNLSILTTLEDGTPVANALVKINIGSLTVCKISDINGKVRFNELPFGPYRIECRSSDNKKVGRVNTTLIYNSQVTVKLTKIRILPTNGIIRFIVVDTYYNPIQGVTVELTSSNPQRSGETNSLGIIDFEGLSADDGSNVHDFTVGSTNYSETLSAPLLFHPVFHHL